MTRLQFKQAFDAAALAAALAEDTRASSFRAAAQLAHIKGAEKLLAGALSTYGPAADVAFQSARHVGAMQTQGNRRHRASAAARNGRATGKGDFG